MLSLLGIHCTVESIGIGSNIRALERSLCLGLAALLEGIGSIALQRSLKHHGALQLMQSMSSALSVRSGLLDLPGVAAHTVVHGDSSLAW